MTHTLEFSLLMSSRYPETRELEVLVEATVERNRGDDEWTIVQATGIVLAGSEDNIPLFQLQIDEAVLERCEKLPPP